MDTKELIPPASLNDDGTCVECAVVEDGLKILGAPVGSQDFVAKSLQGIVKWATATLDLVADAHLPLQHKFVLLRQCVAQIPTFWA
jgi:hypothetical protein